MPRLTRVDLFWSLLTGLATLLVFALALLYAAHHGGPGWLAGQELAVFTKLALLTASLVAIDILWKARSQAD